MSDEGDGRPGSDEPPRSRNLMVPFLDHLVQALTGDLANVVFQAGDGSGGEVVGRSPCATGNGAWRDR